MIYSDAVKLLNKNVHFTASCEFFPKDGITGRVVNVAYSKNNELVFSIIVNHRRITVGANTTGLSAVLV